MANGRWMAMASVVTVAFGCGTRKPPPLVSGSPRPVATPLSAPATAEPAPAPPPAAPREQMPESLFRVVAEYEREAVLHALGDHGFLSVEQELFAIDGELVNADRSLIDGLPDPKGMWRIAHMAGEWPDSAWLEVVEARGAAGRSILFRRVGRRWQRVETLPGERMFVGIVPWTGDRLLGIVQSGFAFDATIRLFGAAKPVALPRFTRAKRAVSFCVNRVHAEAFAALPGGHVFVGGMTCETSGEDARAVGAGIERWEPGQVRGTIDMLPGMDVGPRYDAITVNSIVALSPVEVYAAVERLASGSLRAAQLFRFDGTAWQIVPTGIPRGVASLWRGPDQSLWAADLDGQLWKRVSDDKWSNERLPSALNLAPTTSLWHAANGGVWAVVQQRDRSFVVHARPPAK